MTRTRLAALFLLVALLFLLPSSGDPANAQARRGARASFSPQGGCSLATLQGHYGVLEQGTFFAPLPGAPAPPFPYVNAVNAAFDGKGKTTGTFAASFGGLIMTGTFEGTYEVNDDCTYSDHLVAPGVHLSHLGTITGDGMFREVQIMYTNDVLAATGTAKRVAPSGCSLRTVDGNYSLWGNGGLFAAVFGLTPPIWLAHVGTVTANGDGTFTGRETLNFAGMVLPSTFDATYTVTPDCTAAFAIRTPSSVLHEVGVITGLGPFQEFRGIITDPDWVFADFVKRQ